MKKQHYIIILSMGLLIGVAFTVFRGTPEESSAEPVMNVRVENGKQIIDIDAKGGYSPKITTAAADLPTVIRVHTSSTFDCSSALTIPELDYKTNLPATGVTEIEVPARRAGATLQGRCAMGMYNFAIDFK